MKTFHRLRRVCVPKADRSVFQNSNSVGGRQDVCGMSTDAFASVWGALPKFSESHRRVALWSDRVTFRDGRRDEGRRVIRGRSMLLPDRTVVELVRAAQSGREAFPLPDNSRSRRSRRDLRKRGGLAERAVAVNVFSSQQHGVRAKVAPRKTQRQGNRPIAKPWVHGHNSVTS